MTQLGGHFSKLKSSLRQNMGSWLENLGIDEKKNQNLITEERGEFRRKYEYFQSLYDQRNYFPLRRVNP